MDLLQDAIRRDAFLLDVAAHDMQSIISQTLDGIVARKILPAEHQEAVRQSLIDRESVASTAIGNSMAIPHAYLNVLEEPLIIFVRLRNPVNLGAPDGVPVRFVFMLLGPEGAPREHLDSLAQIARLMSDDEFRYDARFAQSADDLIKALDDFHRRASRPAAATEESTDGLQYTGRLFGGLTQDIRRLGSRYVSDYVDGLTTKSLSSTLFLFFACLAPAVTFGGIMGAQTGGQIGVVEMLVASAACGIVYALFAGQPLIILGGVGPLLVFTTILYQLCVDLELPFLPTYAWIGFWTALILFILAATDASCLMRYFTRFTDEIFSTLMSLIFIYEAIRAIIDIFRRSFAQETFSHDAAFLSLILAIGTFYIATSLTSFRRSKFLLPFMREFLADFGPMIALAAMTAVAWVLRHEVTTSTLTAPDNVQTSADRPWLVDPFAAPMWIWFAAIGPAILAAVLIFLTQNITARLINSPDHKLQKGSAYHLDLSIVAILIGVCSLFGLPWLVAASVRSLAHVRGLSSKEEVVGRKGEVTERITHVEETRITGLAIHILMAASLLLLSVVKLVPMSVLYGIFLFMGVVSLAGNQFVERLTLWLMDPDLYPTTHYIRRVPRAVMHRFTLLQLTCLALLCVVTLSSYDLLRLSFPLFIALLVPVRFLAGRMFQPAHLEALDAEEIPRDEATHWSG